MVKIIFRIPDPAHGITAGVQSIQNITDVRMEIIMEIIKGNKVGKNLLPRWPLDPPIIIPQMIIKIRQEPEKEPKKKWWRKLYQ